VTDHPPGSFSPLAAIGRRRWIALVVMVTVLIAVLAWLLRAPRYYTASSTLTATPSRALLASTGNFDNLETTLAQIANSQAVLSGVAGALPERRTIGQLRNEVHAVRVTGTVLIRITVTDPDPRAAADIANAVARALPQHDPSGGLFVFTMTDAASVPSTFSSPNVKIIVLAGSALALVLGLGAALLYERFAGTVDTRRQLAELTGAEVAAVLTRPNRPVPASGSGPTARPTAGFRSLRAALESPSDGESLGPIVVTSLVPDPGLIAWVAWNSAVALAQVNHRVLLVDSDFDAPHPCAGSFGFTSPGLYALLCEKVSVDDALCPALVNGLTILPAGDLPGTPQDAAPDTLMELRFAKVLAEVADRFDVVLVRAPASWFVDAPGMAAVNRSVLLAVPAGRLRLSAVRRVFEDRRARDGGVVCAVLVRRKRRFHG
jgi:succinoglycan biosynthesis transport protein ExoP